MKDTNVIQNTFIREKMYELSFKESSHLFALKANGTYYEYSLTTEGDPTETEVKFLTSNTAVLLCVVLSCIIAVYSVVSVFLLLLKIKDIFEHKMQNYLKRNRKFARAKREIQKKDSEHTKRNSVAVKYKGMKVKVLKMNLFTTSFYVHNISYADIDEKRLKDKIKDKKKISFSFFKTPALYFDHIRRQRANSFKEFLKCILESNKHFPKWKLNSVNGWKTTSVRLDILDLKYREFCTKEGYKPFDIEKQDKTISRFNLEIIWKMDANTDAYTRIRWKSPTEKIEQNSLMEYNSKFVVEEDGMMDNIVLGFLESE